MKWPWETFGINAPHSMPTENPPKCHDARAVLECLNLEESASACVHFYDSLGRAVVVSDRTPPSEIVKMASRQSGWDIDVYPASKLSEMQQQAVQDFASLDSVSDELAMKLVDQGYFSFDDLSVINPEFLSKLGVSDMATVEAIIAEAEIRAQPSKN